MSPRDDRPASELPDLSELPAGVDPMTGTSWTMKARAQQATKEAAAPKLGGALSPDLDVAKAGKGPLMSLSHEFYKVGPGPSSSQTIGPMRITYDFYQRCTKLP